MNAPIILIYDLNNIGGGAERAQAISNALKISNLKAAALLIIGRKQEAHEVSKELLRKTHKCYLKVVSEQDEERFLGFYLGRIFEQLKEKSRLRRGTVFLFASDKRLASLLVPWIQNGYKAIIAGYNIDLVNYPYSSLSKAKKIDIGLLFESKKPTKPPKKLPFDPTIYPYHYDKIHELNSSLGLKVISLPPWASTPHPIFIPFPLVPDEITIGSHPASNIDIPLGYWDQQLKVVGKKPKYVPLLYSPHAFIGCNVTGWYIRSAKGHRKPPRDLSLNGRRIDSSWGNQTLQLGDVIKLGRFVFEFVSPVFESMKISTDKPRTTHDSLLLIEQSIHAEIIRFLKETAKTTGAAWWNLAAQELREKCERRRNESGARHEHPSNFMTLIEHSEVVEQYWGQIKSAHHFFDAWHSKTQWRRAIGTLNTIRNKVAHPSRLKLTQEEKLFVRRFLEYCSSVQKEN